jgi:hypothetical protein
MRRVLFSMTISHYAREVGPVAEYFLSREIDTHLLVGWHGATADEYARRCEALGCVVHRVPRELAYSDEFAEPESEPAQAGPRRTLLRRVRSVAGRRIYAVSSFMALVRRARQARRFAERLIEMVEPDVVIGSSYRSCGEVDNGIARAASVRSVPYCCVPQGPYLGERNMIDARVTQLETGMTSHKLLVDESWGNRLLALLVRGWTRRSNGYRFFAWTPRSMLAARLAGMLDPNPWQQPSEFYDVCLVESEFSRQMLVASGYEPEKVVPVGRPILDVVYERLGDPEHERRLFADLGLRPGSPFALFNVEPSYEHQYATQAEHWARFHALMQAMRRTGLDVVLSLHPLSDPSNYRFVEDEYGFILSEQYRIGDLHPYCGISVSFPCSTNVMAELFGKPLVVYDWVGMTKEDYHRADLFRLPGATYAYGAEELVARIAEVTSSPGFGVNVLPAADGYVPATARILQEIETRFDV